MFEGIEIYRNPVDSTKSSDEAATRSHRINDRESQNYVFIRELLLTDFKCRSCRQKKVRKKSKYWNNAHSSAFHS